MIVFIITSIYNKVHVNAYSVLGARTAALTPAMKHCDVRIRLVAEGWEGVPVDTYVTYYAAEKDIF